MYVYVYVYGECVEVLVLPDVVLLGTIQEASLGFYLHDLLIVEI